MTNAPRRRDDLLAEMARRNITVTDLARTIGVTRQHLSSVLHGRTSLTKRVARDIARETTIPADVVADEVPA